jgi:hypothetical protein
MNMRWIPRLIVAATLVGCATPRYETIRHYEPPASPAGQACVADCERAQAGCRADCQVAWQACAARVEPKVEARYVQALNDYAEELRRYRRDLDLFEWRLWMGWGRGHGGLWYSPWSAYPWPDYVTAPMPPGGPPTRDTARAFLNKAECKDDCGCQPRYDACYISCGGGVRLEQRRLER